MSLRSLALILLWSASLATASEFPDAATIRNMAARVQGLTFPGEAIPPPAVDTPRMLIYKPEGKGPFPAIVLVHQCGGLGGGRWLNTSMLQWARDAAAKGYVALLLDSLGPRGVDTVCMGPKLNVTFGVGLNDALMAAEHLRKFDFVDKRRIGLAGYSWGAMVALLASSRQWGDALAAQGRFAAAVAFYPGCFTITPKNLPPFEIARQDIDRPVLVLMGGEDNETPAEDCRTRLEPAKAAGAPIELQLYPKATHCWDCRNLDGYTKTDIRGNRVTYRYDHTVTEDSARRMFEFFDRTMPANPPTPGR